MLFAQRIAHNVLSKHRVKEKLCYQNT